MCGIAGTLDLGGSPLAAAERLGELARMACLLGHRGPDESGYFIDQHAALVGVRLAITDLQHGQQPMSDEIGRYWIVYNGEIYNAAELRCSLTQQGHRFQTHCDTEVALRGWMEWGTEAPARFDGGFAFVVYDRLERAAHLVRDRYGKRPLFYAAHANGLIFGSEMKALFGRTGTTLAWDPLGVASIFAKWTPQGDETPFQGVKQVPAGAVLRVSTSGLTLKTYARLDFRPASPVPDFEAAAAQVSSLLRDSVRLRLRGDVEAAVLLSGGLDSAIVAHLVRQEQPGRLQSFSLAFADARFDESADQQRIVEALGLSHTSLTVTGEDIADTFVEALWHAEVPQFRTAFVPMFLIARQVHAGGVKVVLSGEGADEVFVGYDIFKETRLRATWSMLSADARHAAVSQLYPYLPHFSSANARAIEALYARSTGAAADPLFSHAMRFENGRFAGRLLAADLDGLSGLRSAVESEPGFHTMSAVQKAQWLEFQTLLQGYLLSSQGDRMMFAHGVEPRCPFLDPEVVTFVAGLPEHYLLSPDHEEKRLLRHAFRAALPREILSKHKQPYLAPDARSFVRLGADDGVFADWVEDLLATHTLADIGVLDHAATSQFLDKLRRTPKARISPREDQAFLLLLSLSVLHRQFVRRDRAVPYAPHPPLTRVVDMTGHP